MAHMMKKVPAKKMPMRKPPKGMAPKMKKMRY